MTAEENEATTDQCPNEWHRSAPARRRMRCPECPSLPMFGGSVAAEDEGGVDEPDSECEAKGCDLPEGAVECRRCGAEPLVEADEDELARDRAELAEMILERVAEDRTGSAVVTLLEKVWARIRTNHPELPEIVITTGSGLTGGASKWGHFRPDGWKADGTPGRRHELFLAGEALAKGARQTLQTMLHEAVHTLAKVRSVQDTSRQGRWHNAQFRKLAEEMGLEHKASQADSAHGFSFVTLTAATADRYADLLAELDREIRLVCQLPAWLGGSDEEDDQGGEKITGKPKGEGGSNGGNLKATCDCEEPVIIRLSRKVLDLGVVRCDGCGELFTAE